MSSLDRDRFISLWRSIANQHDESHCNKVFDELVMLYSGSDRHYHSDSHINQCLSKMDEAIDDSGYHADVEIAIWFHDVIYEAGDRDNEQKSAELFTQLCNKHFSASFIDDVTKLITATEHRQSPQNEKEKLMVDVDLSSFSLPTNRFLDDGRKIRLEFRHSSTEDFVNGQAKFLRELLDRPTVYTTSYFIRKYEDIARDNIQHLLEFYDRGESP